MTDKLCHLVLCTLLALMPTIGILWILSVPDYFQMELVSEQVIATVLGLATGAALLKYPYREKAGLIDLVLALVAAGVWFWMSYNLQQWYYDMAERPPRMWVPGIFAILLMMEGVRKAAGGVIAGLVWIILIYGFLGNHLPGVFEAEVFPPTKTIVHLYADPNGVPGLVLRIVVELVLAFIIFGKMMDVSGAMKFVNDLSLSLMGHRRGGPAKVAVVASSAFGSISGSTVANIMSTGVVTIPMMKETGFEPKYAAAIEAVASNGGQIAPPVMGATAFIIAEFLEIPYGEVALAALLPAILYFLVLFMQVDGVAVRFGIKGLSKENLPDVRAVLIAGWVFLVPLAVLIYVLIGLGYRAGLAGMYSCGLLLLLMIFRNRRLPSKEEWKGFFIGGGENLVPLVMIAGGAGIIIGLLNSTGLAFQLSLGLTEIAQAYGILAMLILTAFICILLGMGMPTAAVYVVLVSIIAPALIEMKIPELSAHMFIFYYGLLSMLTPPVAVASMVAAQIAGSDMWRTGLIGLQLAAAAFLMPFLWAFNPALLLRGTTTEIVYVVITTVTAGIVIGQMTKVVGSGGLRGSFGVIGLLAAAVFIGGATVWFGTTAPVALIPAGIALLLMFSMRILRQRKLAAETE
ncbi:MAG: TRAP transporter fused permease subunit [Alphaproteobacteria bacterium]|nr:TRAP transporter fused permease subunit [Alphaproteobacteria bacterium]